MTGVPLANNEDTEDETKTEHRGKQVALEDDDADERGADEHDADEHDADEHDAGEHDAGEHDAEVPPDTVSLPDREQYEISEIPLPSHVRRVAATTQLQALRLVVVVVKVVIVAVAVGVTAQHLLVFVPAAVVQC
jgi:hypothetical protein